MKRELFLKIFTGFLSFFVLFGILLPLKSAAKVCGSVLRIHVVANSDSAFDQEIKGLVRERLLILSEGDLRMCANLAEAKAAVARELEFWERELNRFLEEQMLPYGASLSLLTEHHEEKVYEDITLPAGEYLSLRVRLGKAEGQNFFCVLFPPVCKNSSGKSAGELFCDYGFREGEMRILKPSGQRQLRFFLWDRLAELFSR